MAADLAIKASDLGIRYRRYLRKDWTLKDSVLNAFRGTRFESFWALRNLNLDVARGTSLGVVGSNGAGKSTLLKAIAGVLPASEGTIHVHGKVAPLLELGAGFKAELTGRENIYFNGAVMGLSRKQVDERVERIIDFAQIGDFIDAPVHTYSSGMKARLGFAVATEVDADVLLVDETLSVGDAEFKARAEARTKSLFESHHTIVLVSHNLEQIRDLCERAILIRSGHLELDSTPDEVITKYHELTNTVRAIKKGTNP